jgi:serine/threonine protein kinase
LQLPCQSLHGNLGQGAGGDDAHEATTSAVYALSEAAIGIAVAHDARVIHSDIKLANILCSRDLASVKIAYFGLAHVISASQSKVSSIRGTPLFIAPELPEDPTPPSLLLFRHVFVRDGRVAGSAASARVVFLVCMR